MHQDLLLLPLLDECNCESDLPGSCLSSLPSRGGTLSRSNGDVRLVALLFTTCAGNEYVAQAISHAGNIEIAMENSRASVFETGFTQARREIDSQRCPKFYLYAYVSPQKM